MQEQSGVAENHMIKKIFVLLCGLFLLMLSLYLYQTFKPHNSYINNYDDVNYNNDNNNRRYESSTKYHRVTVPEQDEIAGNETNADDRWNDEVYYVDDLFPNSDIMLQRYRVHLTARTWYEAVTRCWEEGGHLATPDNQKEVRQLGYILRVAREAGNITNTEMKDAMHIGLNYIVSNTWTTLEGNKIEIDRFNWIQLVSQNGIRNLNLGCSALLPNDRLTDHKCGERLIYACDMEQKNQSTNTESTFTPVTDDGYEAVTQQSRFRIFEFPLPWLEAFDVCEADGARLMTPKRDQGTRVWEWIDDRISKPLRKGGVWFGINQFTQESIWGSYDSNYFTWNDWVSRSIDREKNCAVFLPNAQMDRISCHEHKPFVCEKKIPENVREKVEYKEVKGLGAYAFHKVPKNWGQAVLQCLFENATLAVPESPEEAEVLADMHRKCSTCWTGYARYNFVWVGINDWDGDKIWRKLTGERTHGSSFNEWHSEADIRDVSALCGGLRDGAFVNGYCENTSPFVCKKEASRQ